MKIMTFSDAAGLFGVSQATISRWVKDGKLKEGTKAGKQKTVTQESTDALLSDTAFQMGQEATKKQLEEKRKVTQMYAKQQEIEVLKQKVTNLENLIVNLSEALEQNRKVVQICEHKIENLCNITQNNIKQKGEIQSIPNDNVIPTKGSQKDPKRRHKKTE